VAEALISFTLNLGQRLVQAANYFLPEKLEKWVTPPLDICMAVALVMFATGRAALAARMAPSTAAKTTEALEAMVGLLDAFQEAVEP